MRFSDPLHLGAFLVGVGAAAWALDALVGLFFLIGLLLFVAGFITLLVARRRVPADTRGLLAGGAAAAVAAVALLGLLFVIGTPVNIGEDPNQGFNLRPPAWTEAAMSAYAPIFLFLLPALVVVTLFLTWSRVERTLGVVGLAILAVVVAVAYAGPTTEEASLGLLSRVVLALGLAAIATAAILPPARSDHAPWNAHGEPPAHREPTVAGHP